ncbi:MAG: hypothetical protein U0354_07185 [Candidatus Sericytochromatia bacterium]
MDNLKNNLTNNIEVTNNILSQQYESDYKAQSILDALYVAPDIVGTTVDIASGSSEVAGTIAEVFGAVCEFIGGICN